MQKNFFYFLAIIGLLILPVFIGAEVYQSNNITSDSAIKNLYDVIKIAKENGDYNCCIDPECTMCFLGHWKFEEGTCACDMAIAEGRTEDVCPECKNGFGEGICTSSNKVECVLDEKIFGGAFE